MRLFALCSFALCLASASAEALTLQHGHLAPISTYTDGVGRTWTSEESAFVAIKLPAVPPYQDFIDYAQTTAGLARWSGTVELWRSELTTQATIDRWIILRVEKPCKDRTGLFSVGRITVCSARHMTAGANGWPVDVAFACDPDHAGWDPYYVAPIFDGTPPEKVSCGDPLGPGPEDPDDLTKTQ